MAMNKVLAKDLALTTSMFVAQLKNQLLQWGNANYTDEELYQKFNEELQAHEHFEGFVLLENEQLIHSVGDLTNEDLKLLTNSFGDIKSSDPYLKDGNEHMLIGCEIENQVVVGEINLSFVKAYIQDLAHVADASGNYFIGGASSNVDIEKPNSAISSNKITETVSELGWKITIDSDDHDNKTDEQHYVEHEAVIRFVDGIDGKQWIGQSDLQLMKNGGPYYVVRDETRQAEQLVSDLEALDEVETAELNFYYTKQTQQNRGVSSRYRNRTLLPNDEFYQPYQWNLTQIFAETGWTITEGTEDVPIAILDSGVDPNHEDLKERIAKGYNAFLDNEEFYDENGHGTHVAGITAATTNNVAGIAGVSWHNPILAVKVLDENAEGTTFEIANGIRWATDHGAKVINMSLGDSHDSKIMYEAIRYAYDHDVVLIAAAGNDNVPTPMFPAAYAEVIAVSAVDDNREKAIFSNYGNHIDVAAPGEHIPSTFIDNHYVIMSGTSMAAPHVAGLAGLMRSINPELSNNDIAKIIMETADDLGPRGYDPYYGCGEINISKALKKVKNVNVK